MADQTHCSKCNGHLRGGGVWCNECGYIHIRCSGLASGRDHYAGFICQTCNLAAAPQDDTNTPPAATPQANPLTTVEINQNDPDTSPNVTPPTPADFWTKITPTHTDFIKKCYSEIVYWKPQFVTLSKNKTGHCFIESLSIIFDEVAEKSRNPNVALYFAMVMPHLVLARRKEKRETFIGKTIHRRMEAWLSCEFEALFNEAKALQLRIPKVRKTQNRDEMKSFDTQMSSGKISNALRCLDESQKGNVLSLQDRVGNKTVMQILQEKHPKPMTSKDSYVTNENDHTLEHHHSIFDKINASTVRKTAMVTQGSHGPSGVDANDWRRWLSHFGQASTNLCKALAAFARRLATDQMHDLNPYNACRLIPLDKNPGVRPIGVGEVIRRIIGRNILWCIGNDLKILGQNRQLCLGQKCGIEHAIHSLRETFELPETEGLLLIDAKNAFNSLNRDLALKNIQKTCPSIITALRNSYGTPSNLYVNGKTLLSQEGTTQGDPLAMSMYGIALLPLMDLVNEEGVLQKWYADDGNVAGSIESLRNLFEKLKLDGPAFGYNINKCHLITKDSSLGKAKDLFKDEDVELVAGHRVLGSVIGSPEACHAFQSSKLTEYTNIVNKLASHAKKSPQNVYHAFTKGVQHKLTFLSRTTPDMENTAKHRISLNDETDP